MSKTLYLECSAGISGDMLAAALLDLGADSNVLMNVLESLPVDGYTVKIGRVKKAGIDCCDFDVRLDEEHENHDHDMAYLHGHDSEKGHHSHSGGEEGCHCHTDHAHHAHEHRNLSEIMQILDEASMTDRARATAKKIFEILAKAEAQAHGIPLEKVHFHEVGAADSIADIVAIAVCLDNLDIVQAVVPKLCEGTGTVRCQHGVLPVPVPAVANIMQAYEIPVHFLGIEGEFVTPTGAASVAAIRTCGKLPDRFRIEKTGIGAGKRNYEIPSMLRAMLISEIHDEKENVVKLETNIDDCTGEMLGFVMERLFEAGARDVHYTPVYMKKNRPGWQLNVICTEEDKARIEQIIFEETTTIGIRCFRMERDVLPREQKTVRTPWGDAEVKACRLHDRTRYYPEYESVARICREQNRPYLEVYEEILRLCDGQAGAREALTNQK